MPDDIFEHPRLVAIYDALDPDRSDLDVYAAIAEELGARRVLDIGCGTGTFALFLARRGLDVIAVDPAAASIAVANGKPGAERVQWIHGDATGLPPTEVDLATMTANVAQAIADPQDWRETLRGAYDALRPGGHLSRRQSSGIRLRDRRRARWRERLQPPRHEVRIRRRGPMVGPGRRHLRMAAARRCAASLEPFASGAHVNTLTDEGSTGIRRAYPPHKLARLTALKDVYDPDNVFHLNQNISPLPEPADSST